MPASQPAFYNNVTVGGGPPPVRAYIDELLPKILYGRIQPGRVFDQTVDLEGCRTATERWRSAKPSRC